MFTTNFIIRLLIDLVTVIIMIRFIYYPTYRRWDYLFPFLVLNFMVFLLSFMLFKTKVFSSSIAGFGGIGLLAAFTLLRFRTETISVKNMTYLFVFLALGLINSIMDDSLEGIAMINGLILIAVYITDGNSFISNGHHSKVIELDDLTNVKPDQQEALIAQLVTLTGINIKKVQIESIDFRRETMRVRIYYSL